MIRKILSLALVLAMVFLLYACGQEGAKIVDIQNSVQEGKEKLESVENCCLVLQISINPQLELYLDADGTVLKAVSVNKDAEQLLAALQLTGLSFDDAVRAILGGAKE